MTEHALPADIEGLGLKGAGQLLRTSGWTDAAIGRAFGVSRQRVQQILGNRPTQPRRQERSVSVEPAAYERAREIARELGLVVPDGPQQGAGSVAALVEAIGTGQVDVRRKSRRRHIPPPPAATEE